MRIFALKRNVAHTTMFVWAAKVFEVWIIKSFISCPNLYIEAVRERTRQ